MCTLCGLYSNEEMREHSVLFGWDWLSPHDHHHAVTKTRATVHLSVSMFVDGHARDGWWVCKTNILFRV